MRNIRRVGFRYIRQKRLGNELSKAFRYVNYQAEGSVTLDSISMLYEYSPVAERGSFNSSDVELNKIYDVAKYTFHLNTREFFIDGIKRDRWVWSGDCIPKLFDELLFVF